MRKIAIASVVLLTAVLGFGLVAVAQRDSKMPKPGVEVPIVTPGPGWKACPRCLNDGHIAAARAKAKVDTRTFDKHDLSGVWSGNPEDLGGNGQEVGERNAPPFTPGGQKMYEATVSDAEWSSKDPRNVCDPMGFPRSYGYNYGIEFLQLPGRTIEFFEQGHYWRTIYTDGRKLPPDPPTLRYFGYAIGHWDGDTFVVESTGYDDRTWIGGENGQRNPAHRQAGFPHSDQMRIVEHYKRINYGQLQSDLTITDPKIYTAPWKSPVSIINLVPDTEIAEHPCVPSDEIDFNQRNIIPALQPK